MHHKSCFRAFLVCSSLKSSFFSCLSVTEAELKEDLGVSVQTEAQMHRFIWPPVFCL